MDKIEAILKLLDEKAREASDKHAHAERYESPAAAERAWGAYIAISEIKDAVRSIANESEKDQTHD